MEQMEQKVRYSKTAMSIKYWFKKFLGMVRAMKIPCPLCGDESCEFTKETGGGTFGIASCPSCHFVFTWPRQTPEELKAFYSTLYLRGTYIQTPPSKESISYGTYADQLARARGRELKFLLKHKESGRLLDLGSAWGGFLSLAKQNGFDAQGVEVALPNVRFAEEELGLHIFHGDLLEAGFPEASFDAVTAIHFLEHTLNPREVLREVFRILAPDGFFLVMVPNWNAYLRRKMGRDWHWISPNDHYNYFTPDVLRRELESAGLAVTELFSEEGHYGEETLRMYVPEKGVQELYKGLEGSELVAFCTKEAVRVEKEKEGSVSISAETPRGSS